MAIFLFGSALCSCNSDDATPIEDTMPPQTVYGSYLFNGVEKEIHEAWHRMLFSGTLEIGLVDEDERELMLYLNAFSGPGVHEFPAIPQELFARQYIGFNNWEHEKLLYQDSSRAEVFEYNESGAVAGSFDLHLVHEGFVTRDYLEGGDFSNVPMADVPGVPHAGMVYYRSNRKRYIDSLQARISNTFLLETYVYASTRGGNKTVDIFRMDIGPDGEQGTPRIYHGPLLYAYALQTYVEAAYDYNANAQTMSSPLLTAGSTDMQIRFDGVPITDFPKAFGAPGEILLYKGNDMVAFTSVTLDIEWYANPILTATNPQGNYLKVVYAPISNSFMINTNPSQPGGEVLLEFYESENDTEPAWSRLGSMRYKYSSDQTVNIGFETATPHFSSEELVVIRGTEIAI